MPAFDLAASVDRARRRFGSGGARQRRSDAGKLRLPAATVALLRPLLLDQGRPRMVDLQRELAAACQRRGLKAPARATLYACLALVEPHGYRVVDLPRHVQGALYNLDVSATVPGHQLAFYCFNHGDLAAISYAAGLPWLDLFQAAKLGGWRPRSRGLLQAVLQLRHIA
jgi:hypothetical protein